MHLRTNHLVLDPNDGNHKLGEQDANQIARQDTKCVKSVPNWHRRGECKQTEMFSSNSSVSFFSSLSIYLLLNVVVLPAETQGVVWPCGAVWCTADWERENTHPRARDFRAWHNKQTDTRSVVPPGQRVDVESERCGVETRAYLVWERKKIIFLKNVFGRKNKYESWKMNILECVFCEKAE